MALTLASVAAFIGALSASVQAHDPTLAPEIQQAIQLRARNGLRELTSSHTIYVHSISAHHLTDEYTRVATRGTNGIWQVISIGEERQGLVGRETRLIPEARRMLTRIESRNLDRLLRQPALFGETPRLRRNPPIGAIFHTMEIVAPGRRTVVRWTGRLRGMTGQVADLIMGRAEAD